MSLWFFLVAYAVYLAEPLARSYEKTRAMIRLKGPTIFEMAGERRRNGNVIMSTLRLVFMRPMIIVGCCFGMISIVELAAIWTYLSLVDDINAGMVENTAHSADIAMPGQLAGWCAITKMQSALCFATAFVYSLAYHDRNSVNSLFLIGSDGTTNAVILDVAVGSEAWLNMSDGLRTDRELCYALTAEMNTREFWQMSPTEELYARPMFRNKYGPTYDFELLPYPDISTDCIDTYPFESKNIGINPSQHKKMAKRMTGYEDADLAEMNMEDAVPKAQENVDVKMLGKGHEWWPVRGLTKAAISDRSASFAGVARGLRMGADVRPMPCHSVKKKTERLISVLQLTLLYAIPRWADPYHGCLTCGVEEYVRSANLSANPGHVTKLRLNITAAAGMAVPAMHRMATMYTDTWVRSDNPNEHMETGFFKPECIKLSDIRKRVIHDPEERRRRRAHLPPALAKIIEGQYQYLESKDFVVTKTRVVEAMPADKIAEQKIDIVPTNHALAIRKGQGPSLIGSDTAGDFVSRLASVLISGYNGLACDAKEFDMHITQSALAESAYITLRMFIGNAAKQMASHGPTWKFLLTEMMSYAKRALWLPIRVIFMMMESHHVIGDVRYAMTATVWDRFTHSLEYIREYYCEMPRAVVMYADGVVQEIPGKFRSGSTKTSDDNTLRQILCVLYYLAHDESPPE
jgi:hypothetical protein